MRAGQAVGDHGPPVVVLPQSSVESGQLPQLHLAKVVLVLGRLDALLQDVANLQTVQGNSSTVNVWDTPLWNFPWPMLTWRNPG